MTHFRKIAAPPRPHWSDGEPALDELMRDPLVHLVMKRDNLVPDDVWPVLHRAGQRLRSRLCPLKWAA